jgi:hypothetical protein
VASMKIFFMIGTQTPTSGGAVPTLPQASVEQAPVRAIYMLAITTSVCRSETLSIGKSIKIMSILIGIFARPSIMGHYRTKILRLKTSRCCIYV